MSIVSCSPLSLCIGSVLKRFHIQPVRKLPPPSPPGKLNTFLLATIIVTEYQVETMTDSKRNYARTLKPTLVHSPTKKTSSTVKEKIASKGKKMTIERKYGGNFLEGIPVTSNAILPDSCRLSHVVLFVTPRQPVEQPIEPPRTLCCRSSQR